MLILSITSSAAPPPTPGQVWVTPDDTSSHIAWQPVAGATGYHVKYSNRRTGGLSVVGENVSGTTWTHEGLRNGRRAYYAVSAFNENGESQDSARIQCTPSAPVLHWLSPGARIEKLADRMQFTEGPVWNPANGGFLIFSDINGNRLHQWDFDQGLSVFRDPSQRANGNTLDLEGRLITCEHLTRRVTRTEPDGSIVPILETHDGNRFNSPNDVVVKSDGTIWFTDPTWGLSGRKEIDGQYVYCHDPVSGETTRVADGFQQPNGLCFSPDESILYVAESAGPLNVRAFDVQADGTLANDRIFVDPAGTPDGMRVDSEGRLYVTAEDVFVYAPDGTQVARIDVPEVPANLCFGGPNNDMMFVTARTSLYGITRQPDLVVTSVHSIPETPAHAEGVTLQAVITNQGTGPTSPDQPLEINFLAGTSPTFILMATFTGELAPGASALISVDPAARHGFWFPHRGSQTVQAIVDLNGAIAESSDANNSRTITVSVTSGTPLRAGRNADTGGPELILSGLIGEHFQIQTSSDLITWSDWRTVVFDRPGAMSLVPEEPSSAHLFFRAIEVTESP